MTRTALEFVPPNIEAGTERVKEDCRKIRDLSVAAGIEGMIDHIMIPGMIAEDDDRPVPMKPKMDPLDVWNQVHMELPDMKGMCTQVTAFHNSDQLTERFSNLTGSGIESIIFVGVPRTMADGEGDGVSPIDALSGFQQQVQDRGVILIPTRKDEDSRFRFKCDKGATFGLCQLLYSDAIVDFLRKFAEKYEYRPEILLSFGFVPRVEQRIGLINWLIQDPGNDKVKQEQAFVAELAGMKLRKKQRTLLDLYKRVVDGVVDLGFPVSLHLEAPYGFSKPAFDTFAMMLDYWEPVKDGRRERD
jgi:hypothetical protein